MATTSTPASLANLQVIPLLCSRQQRRSGFIAAIATIVIWSTYFLSLRSSALSPLSVLEISLFRYVIPAVLLCPLLIKRWSKITEVAWPYLLGMIAGAGLPFFLCSAIAMSYTPVAQGSTLVPGVAPLFVTAIAVLVFKQPFERHKKIGLTAIFIGVLLLLANSFSQSSSQQLLGQAMFLCASLLWAVFTLSTRQSGLSPLETAAVITVPNALILIIYTWLTPNHNWGAGHVPISELLSHMLIQGIIVGLLASCCYSFAISRLGAELSSALGSLTPVLASLLAFWLFAENLDPLTIFGIISTVIGVVIASGYKPSKAPALHLKE
ncbi:EamA family transporter [Agarivorans sp. B2Z047]|uniref:DMT family transporter n=1 Tax=Agarivorans sp. B2Z047 TaxID=2652721 RepID=UPI00128D7A55|nr:DMT family transporter [Agarivorans sp. B2Z047]MPW30554.1 EamA family transporter [Agarivorans sp. B2Z047]UQN42222.1 DMT family transporter [Agarivorans sp. B2Z047]